MRTRHHIVSIGVTICVTAGLMGATHAEPLRIGVLTWVGNGPLFVAREKGFFAKEGVEVELIDMAVHEASYAGLFAGQVDIISVTVDDMLPNYDPEQPYVCVLAIDESLGGDGIIASNEIHSVANLKGKTVAFPKRTVSEFYLNVLLRNAGLSEADIEPVEMSFDDAANAFLMQEVDAAVSCGTVADQRQAGRARASPCRIRRRRPGLIVDCLVTKTVVFADRLAEFQALARAWDAAVHYAGAHPDEVERDHGAKCRRVARGPGGVRRHPEGRPVLRFRAKPGVLRHTG